MRKLLREITFSSAAAWPSGEMQSLARAKSIDGHAPRDNNDFTIGEMMAEANSLEIMPAISGHAQVGLLLNAASAWPHGRRRLAPERAMSIAGGIMPPARRRQWRYMLAPVLINAADADNVAHESIIYAKSSALPRHDTISAALPRRDFR